MSMSTMPSRYRRRAKAFTFANDPFGYPAEYHHKVLRWLEDQGLITIVSMDDREAWLVSHKKSFAHLMEIPFVERAPS